VLGFAVIFGFDDTGGGLVFWGCVAAGVVSGPGCGGTLLDFAAGFDDTGGGGFLVFDGAVLDFAAGFGSVGGGVSVVSMAVDCMGVCVYSFYILSWLVRKTLFFYF
jgi:hypothetical protein